MRSLRAKGILLFPLCVLVGGAFTGAAGAGDKGTSAAASTIDTPKARSQAMLAAAGRGAVIPPRIADIEQMCAMLIGCGNIPIQLPTSDLGLCIRHFWERLSSPAAIGSSLAIRECGLGAMSCSQFARCALRGAETTDCQGRGMGASEPVGRCDLSGRALHCLEGRVVSVRDCPRGGELCAAHQGQAECVSGRCTSREGDKPKAVCSPDKKRISTCKDGRQVSLSCDALGLQCKNIEGTPKCVPAASPACTGEGERCDGSTAIKCVDGHEVRVQCTQAGLACGVGASAKNRVGLCAMPPDSNSKKTCDPKKFATQCRGNAVEYCVGGKRRTYNCKTYFGTQRCEGQPGQAHCVK